MVRRLLHWAVFVWISLGTLLMIYTSAMAVRDPKLHLGLGIVHLMGARALFASLPLSFCGLAGLWLLLRQRLTGPYLLALFSLTWSICLGADAWKDFDPVIAGTGGLYLLAAAWSIWTARHWHETANRRAKVASAGSEQAA